MNFFFFFGYMYDRYCCGDTIELYLITFVFVQDTKQFVFVEFLCARIVFSGLLALFASAVTDAYEIHASVFIRLQVGG